MFPSMARFLFASMPSAGHTNPLKPIARALVQAGHAVDWYAGLRLRDGVLATGAAFVPMHPELDQHGDSFNDDHPGRAGRTGLAGIRWDLKHLFLDPVPRQVAELHALVAGQRYDALVADMGFVGAAAFHELTGAPWVSVGISPLPIPSRDTAPFGTALPPSATFAGRLRNRALYALMDHVLLRDVGKHWAAIRARLELPPTVASPLSNISPMLHLQNGVAAFEYPRSDLPPQVRFVGSLDAGPAADFTPPPWWSDVTSGGRPVVHVTQGTVANADLSALVTRTIRVLAGADVLVVATTGGADPAVLGPLPANARAAAFIPHGALLPHTSAMVTNGGYGGVQTALAHGVPLVVAGVTEDKPEVAARVAWTGAGLRLRSAAPADEDLRAAIDRVLTEPSFTAGAARLRDAYAAIDTPATLLALVGAVAGSAAGRT
ncbi:glycosyltransferase [Dactylosporangium siamense]|uniref:Glycosyl transferase n=2 Tax=Dactylosporangium siamense TaxID=685454 RepID=A0A919PX47_9ACTN|nr:glycosyl transferase [Dactylosporangium siamense]